jgi:hypothetical protein
LEIGMKCFYIKNRDERIEKRVSEKNAFNKFQEGGGGVVYRIGKVLVVP